MTHKNDQQTQPVVPKSRGLAMSMVRSMADVTWRMFGPPAVLVPAGLWADLAWRTRPWLTIVGAVAGLGLSVVLVRQQLRASQ